MKFLASVANHGSTPKNSAKRHGRYRQTKVLASLKAGLRLVARRGFPATLRNTEETGRELRGNARHVYIDIYVTVENRETASRENK